MLRCRTAEERINKAQGRPEAMGCVDEGEAPSNTKEETCQGGNKHARPRNKRLLREGVAHAGDTKTAGYGGAWSQQAWWR